MNSMQSSGRQQDPVRILRELSSVVTDIVGTGGPATDATGLVDWCTSLRDDPPAPKLLAKLVRLGADLELLLLVGVRFRTSVSAPTSSAFPVRPAGRATSGRSSCRRGTRKSGVPVTMWAWWSLRLADF